jgi:uncharacterized cupin superfamily protein
MGPVHESDLEWTETERGETTFKRKQLGEAADNEQLGCSLYELPAESKSWPYHYHTANEEAIYVLGGTGILRLDGDTYDIRTGHYVCLPAAESGAHRVVNDSDEPLRYLAFSTMNDPDVTRYPDSGKVGVFVGAPPGGRDGRVLTKYYHLDDDVDYWDGE